MGGFQPRRGLGTVGARTRRAAIHGGGEHERHVWRGYSTRRRALPVHALQERLPSLLPEPGAIPEPALAAGCCRSITHGAPAWRLLPRLLLVSDAAAVRRRCHESCLDRRYRPLRRSR